MKKECKKYILTNEKTTTEKGIVLYRIRALRDIDLYRIKAGDLGGFVASENNLSHQGSCWVFSEAHVLSGTVQGDARVNDFAQINGGVVGGRAVVAGCAKISGNAVIGDDAVIGGHSRVFDRAIIFGFGMVYGSAHVFGDAKVFGQATICDNALIYGNAWAFGDVIIGGNVRVSGFVRCSADTVIEGSRSYQGRQVMNDAYMERFNRRVKQMALFL